MKLHFEPDLEYQHAAIDAVCGIFRGQEINRTEFSVAPMAGDGSDPDLPGWSGLEQAMSGTGNRLSLDDDRILQNLRSVQVGNGLPPSENLQSGDFTVEMETGTGKTYVYLRTAFELNRRFGFTKFVVVVPSVAIKEGVYKTLHITEAHFRSLYSGQPFEYFLYDSGRLGEVRNFATSPNIVVMVATVGAINKRDVNNLYKPSEKTGGDAPIDLIRATRPILIVDEPQSVDGGLRGRGREALSAMNPLCVLRYSAVHADRHHMVYRLDAVDAYEQELVKQIEVASLEVEGGHNRAFLRFLSTSRTRGSVTARVEIDVQEGRRVRRKTVTVQGEDDLEKLTGRKVYRDCRIGEIRAGGEPLLEVRTEASEEFLKIGEAVGDVDQDVVKRLMIRRTLHEHLLKEKRLTAAGVKVLSLFFVDRVEHYRSYDEGGNSVKGKYAVIFEEEYRRASRLPEFAEQFAGIDAASDAATVHDGYFSIDRNRRWADTAENNQANRDSAERAYNLIMKDKERLLAFGTRLRFIFSHSALKEGWDNPNVFQICPLREIGAERERRQTIGRGLRLCVNQQGERLRGHDLNTLTVIATERYEDFAENLQKEIANDTGIRFGVVASHQFAAIPVARNDGTMTMLGVEASADIVRYLRNEGFIDAEGRILDVLRKALKEDRFALPDAHAGQLPQVRAVLRKIAGRLEIRNADDRKTVKPRRAVLHSAEFRALWERIKHKTTYRVRFDNERLIAECAEAIREGPAVPRARVKVRKADLAIGQGGVLTQETATSAPIVVDEGDIVLPDLLTELQDRTQLTRRSLVRILLECARLDDFRRNPQAFIESAAELVNRAKKRVLVDGIRYRRLGDGEFYAQELFEQEELTGYLESMLMNTQKSAFEHVIHDSAGVERRFAEALERDESVKVYAKLPAWFRVPTPLGSYNPDWAVLVETGNRRRLYLVVETKGSLFADDLRNQEAAKIACGRAHFAALARTAGEPRFVTATNLDDAFNQAEGA
ncbi:MAG: restriction endonuclease subunit R [Boseongicola sp. SB0664_bin_43]|uniref:Restriction endonuclease subunit R n=1 Tax=Boseongicola sp. SB0664_bin_43 TaxID=2604844 RepID=A0A6B0XZ04_9RHOB|nr:restriction endonuclease subunit R [Boseongicola sp. SB0664_bin_43]